MRLRVFVCTILFVALAASAASAAQTHIVQPGDTLWALASQYGVSVEAIARANALTDVDRLRLGQRLTIPLVGTRRATAGVRKGEAIERYEVREGDTLWALGKRYGMRVEDLAALNGIGVESTLRIGQVLKVKVIQARDRKAKTVEAMTIKAKAEAMRPAIPASPLRVRQTRPLSYRGVQWASSLIGLARRFVGTRYRWGGSAPGGFDCSGFLYYVYGRMDVTLPRTTFAMFHAGRPVPAGDLMPGDMVFFTTYRPGPSHAGIYIGDGQFLHSSSGFGSVTITPLSKDYYRKRYLGARRF